jgi:acyl carrier protein
VLEIVTEWIRSSALARFPAAEVDADTNIIETGLLDSVEILYLVGFLEERFGIALPVEEFIPENFASAQAIAELVSRLTGSQTH